MIQITKEVRKEFQESRRGIKISIFGRSKTNHYTDQDEGIICSECFHFVALAHRFCWWCGCSLSTYSYAGDWNDIVTYRYRYQNKEEQEETDWEENNKDNND